MSDNEDIRKELLSRLRRIEGQVRGIERMIEQDRQCQDILTQLVAIRRGIDQVGLKLLNGKIEECLSGVGGESISTEALREALKMWTKIG